MKKFYNNLKATILLFALVGITSLTYAQGINYQAVVRNGSGAIVANQNVDLKFTIKEGAINRYVEEHLSINSDAQGIVNVVIGDGTPVTGTFAAVDWTNATAEKLQVEIDLGSGYVNMGTQDLESVPYALNVPFKGISGGGIQYENTNTALQKVEIAATTIASASDLLTLQVQTAAPDNAQFIEFQRGNTIEAAINTDGSAEFKDVKVKSLGTTATPATGTLYAEAVPLAWGNISSLGVIQSEFGIASAAYNSTTKVYTVTLDKGWTGSIAVVVTPFTSIGNGEIAGVGTMNSTAKTIQVQIRDAANPSTVKATQFMIVVYGKP